MTRPNRDWKAGCLTALALIAVVCLGTTDTHGATVRTRVITTGDAENDGGVSSTDHKVIIEAIEPEIALDKDATWLGVMIEECSEALASQLGLRPGEGLLATYISPDSPAAKAGLQKNDVLAECDGQLLVHPAQLRKLIQMHKEGDKIQLTLYRAGKKQTVEATVAKRPATSFDERAADIRVLKRQLNELPIGEAVREQMKNLRESLAHAQTGKEALSAEVQSSIEEVRKAIQEALRQVTNAVRTFGPAAREFEELARRGLDVEDDATVVVKSKGHSVRSVVKTDDSGTYVLVANPKKQLTAHDKSGKLLFDGQIETTEEQAKVPKDVWERVKPMLEQLNEDKAAKPVDKDDTQ